MESTKPSSSAIKSLQLCWGHRFAAPHDVDWHTHDVTELVLVTAGRCIISVGGMELAGEAGALFVLPAGVPQYQRTLEETHTTFVGLRLPPGVFDDRARVLSLDLRDLACVWLEQLCDWQMWRPAPGPETTRCVLEALLRRLKELDVINGTQARLHPAVVRAMELIDDDLTRALSLDELARAAGVSASHLGALFTAQCQCSPLQYQQRRRIERATWLLDNPYLRVNEVAAACGYDDVNYFVRLFRQRHGLPPGRWRSERVRPPTRS